MTLPAPHEGAASPNIGCRADPGHADGTESGDREPRCQRVFPAGEGAGIGSSSGSLPEYLSICVARSEV